MNRKPVQIILALVICLTSIYAFQPRIHSFLQQTQRQADSLRIMQLLVHADAFVEDEKYDSAEIYYNESAGIIRKYENWSSYVRCQLKANYCNLLSGNTALAKQRADTLERIAYNFLSNSSPIWADIYFYEGILYAHQERYKTAIGFLEKATKYIQPLPENYLKFARLHNTIGNSYYDYKAFKEDKYSKAVFNYKKTLDYLDKLEDNNKFLATVSNNIGIVNLLWEKPGESTTYFNNAIKQQRSITGIEKNNVFHYYINLAFAYYEQNKFDLCLSKIEQGLEYHSLIYPQEDHPSYGTHYYLKGLINFQNEKYNQALKDFKKAIKLWEGEFKTYCRNIVHTYSYISEIYTIKEKNRNEFKYFELEDDFRDSCYKWNPLERGTYFIYHSYEHLNLIYGFHKEYIPEVVFLINEPLKYNLDKEVPLYAKNYADQEAYRQQYESYKQMLPAVERSVGEQNAEIAENVNEQALKSLEKENFDNALELFQQVLNVGIQSVEEMYPALIKSEENQKRYEKILDYTSNKLVNTRQSNNKDSLAENYNELGLIYTRLGAYDSALNYFEKSLEIKEKSSEVEPNALLENFNNLGIVLNKKGDYKKAISYFEKGSQLSDKRAANEDLLVQNLNNLGIVYDKIEEYDLALESFNKALEIKKEKFSDKDSELASSYSDIGIIEQKKSNYNKALINFNKALEINKFNFGESNETVAKNYSQIGKAMDEWGKAEDAIQYYQKSLEVKKKIKAENDLGIAATYYELGVLYQKTNNYDEALAALEQSLKIKKSNLGEEDLTIASDYEVIGNIYADKDDFTEAISFMDKALVVKRKYLGNKHNEVAKSLNDIGTIYSKTKNYDKALDYFQRALIANVSDFQNTNPKSNPSEEQTLNKIQLSEILNNKAKTLYDLYEQNETKDEELIHTSLLTFDQSLDVIEKLSVKVASPAEYKLVKDYSHRMYNDAINIAAKTNKIKAFEYSERNKSTIMLSSIYTSKQLKFSNVPDSLQYTESNINKDISLLNKYIEHEKSKLNPDYDKIDFWQKELSILQIEYTQLLKYLSENHSDYYNFINNSDVMDVETIQSEYLRKKQALINYKLTDTLLYIFITTHDLFEVVSMPFKDIARQNIQDYKSALTNSDFGHHTMDDFHRFTDAAYKLYQSLIQPIEKFIKNKSLIILPDESLNYISFDALLSSPASNQSDYRSLDYLIKKYPLSYSSLSATYLFKFRKTQNRKGKDEILAFAPDYSKFSTKGTFQQVDLSPLPGAEEEIKNISRYLPTQIFTGDQATKENFLQYSGKYNLLHLAMHTMILDNQPMYSQLAFTPVSDSLKSNFLNVYEIFDLRLNADMAVLSACNTGLGALKNGEGLISLSGGFLYAGVPSIIVTLWPVRDQSSALLMDEFYHQLSKGKSKDLALQKAKTKYLFDSDAMKVHPYYWAGYIHLGDTRAIRNPIWKNPVYLFILIGILLTGFITKRYVLKRKSR